jgi:hypothetical protein
LNFCLHPTDSTITHVDVVEKKLEIKKAVQGEVTKIVALISTAITAITELEVVQLVEADLKTIVGLVVELIVEIVFTLLGVVKVLKISKWNDNLN